MTYVPRNIEAAQAFYLGGLFPGGGLRDDVSQLLRRHPARALIQHVRDCLQGKEVEGMKRKSGIELFLNCFVVILPGC